MLLTVAAGMPGPLSATVSVPFLLSMVIVSVGLTLASSQASSALSAASLRKTSGHAGSGCPVCTCSSFAEVNSSCRDVTKVARCSVVALRVLIGHYPAGLVFGSRLASRLLLGDVLDDLVFVPADAATTGHDLERGGEVAAIDGFENFSFLDEPKANAFRSRYRRDSSEIRDFENAGFDLPPHCRPAGAGQATPFADPPAQAIIQLRSRRHTLPCASLSFWGTDSVHSGSPFVGEPYIRSNVEICLVRSYDLFSSNRPVFRYGAFELHEHDHA